MAVGEGRGRRSRRSTEHPGAENGGLGAVTMCQCGFTASGGCAAALTYCLCQSWGRSSLGGRAGGVRELSVPSPRVFCEPKTALETKRLKKKNQTRKQNKTKDPTFVGGGVGVGMRRRQCGISRSAPRESPRPRSVWEVWAELKSLHGPGTRHPLSGSWGAQADVALGS